VLLDLRHDPRAVDVHGHSLLLASPRSSCCYHHSSTKASDTQMFLQTDRILTSIWARQMYLTGRIAHLNDKKEPHRRTGISTREAAATGGSHAPNLLTTRPATMQVGDWILMLVIADGMVL
jgi:hypothetical protein